MGGCNPSSNRLDNLSFHPYMRLDCMGLPGPNLQAGHEPSDPMLAQNAAFHFIMSTSFANHHVYQPDKKHSNICWIFSMSIFFNSIRGHWIRRTGRCLRRVLASRMFLITVGIWQVAATHVDAICETHFSNVELL